jgi:riboflavin kinase/FMN adenylyltransferase
MPRRFPTLANPASLPAALARPVVAIGNFDGVHRGHRFVMEEAMALGRTLRRPAAVMTFDPHPRAFFQRDVQHFRLTPVPVQASLIESIGLDGLIVFSFDAAFAGLAAEAFIDDILIRRLGVSGVVVGADFHFGRGREGTPATLAAAGKARGFEVLLLDQLDEGDAPVSSSRIRKALEAGEIAAANQMLGYEWFVRGTVSHGEKRGRDLGYPTANMALDPGCRLAHGVYAVRARIDGTEHPAVASFGRRPMFDNGAPLLETHVFDFAGDLYGKTIDIAFAAYLRPEMRFDSLQALIAQMDADSARARALLKQTPLNLD